MIIDCGKAGNVSLIIIADNESRENLFIENVGGNAEIIVVESPEQLAYISHETQIRSRILNTNSRRV